MFASSFQIYLIMEHLNHLLTDLIELHTNIGYDKIMPQTSTCFRVVGSRSRSQLIFLDTFYYAILILQVSVHQIFLCLLKTKITMT